MQNTGTVKPPGGMVTECLQVASAAPASTWVTTPEGNGKAANVPTTRAPPALLVVSMRVGPQHANVVLVVEVELVLVVEVELVLVVELVVVEVEVVELVLVVVEVVLVVAVVVLVVELVVVEVEVVVVVLVVVEVVLVVWLVVLVVELVVVEVEVVVVVAAAQCAASVLHTGVPVVQLQLPALQSSSTQVLQFLRAIPVKAPHTEETSSAQFLLPHAGGAAVATEETKTPAPSATAANVATTVLPILFLIVIVGPPLWPFPSR
jgi:hypothetical protein